MSSCTYAPVAADVGKTLKVRVSFRDDDNTAENRTSVATGTVLAAPRACTTGNHWCATLTVGVHPAPPGADNGGRPTGYCSSASGRCTSAREYGGLSDADFILDGTTYVVESLRWGSTINSSDQLHLTLDRDFPAADLAGLALKVDAHILNLRAANIETPGSRVPANNYAWEIRDRGAEAIQEFPAGARVTVELLPDPNTLATGAPAVTGTAQVGQTLTADTSGIADTDLPATGLDHVELRVDSHSFRLNSPTRGNQRNSVSNNYRWANRPAALGGFPVGVRVTVQLLTVFDFETPGDATGAPEIVGFPQVGNSLLARPGDIADPDGLPDGLILLGGRFSSQPLAYQWLRVGAGTVTEIPGATLDTYTPVAADVGKALRFRVRFRDDSDELEILFSEPTRPVLALPTCSATSIWCSTLLVGTTSDPAPRGYCGARVGAPCTEDHGALANGSFTLDSTNYTVLSVRWGTDSADGDNNPDGVHKVHLSTKPVLPGAVLSRLSLSIGSNVSLALSSATRGLRDTDRHDEETNADGNLRWRRPSALGTLGVGDLVTVELLDSSQSAPEFPDDTLTRSVAENTAPDTDIGAVIPAATDDNPGDTLTYSMEGDDAGSFAFDASARQIKTKAGVGYDFEAKSSYSVTVRVRDTRGGTDTVAVTINLTDVDERPSAPAAPIVTATPGLDTRVDVSWSAPDNAGKPDIDDYDLQYRKQGETGWTDGPQDVSATTTTATIPNLEVGTSYEVQVRATNDEGTSEWSAAGVGSTNSMGNNPPVFPSDTALTREIPENTPRGTAIGAPVPEATDADADTLTYTMEGADAVSFAFDPSTRQISTGAHLDYERKSSYSVTVKADDGKGGADTVAVTITVTDVFEAPRRDGEEMVSNFGQFGVFARSDLRYNDNAQAFTTGADPRGYKLTDAALEFHQSISGDPAGYRHDVSLWTATPAGTPGVLVGEFVVPVFSAASGDQTLRYIAPGNGFDLEPETSYVLVLDVTARGSSALMVYATNFEREDAGAAPGWSIADSALVRAWSSDGEWTANDHARKLRVFGYGKSGANTAPVFRERALERRVAVNSPAGTAVGGPIPEATDADGDPLSYTMEGADAALFAFDAAARQIETRTGAVYDRRSYSVTIRVTDGRDSDTVAVGIEFYDAVNAPPDAPAAPSVSRVTGAASTSSLDVSWSAPENGDRPAVTSYDLQFRAQGAGAWTAGPQDVAGTSATLTELSARTTYEVQVRATNAVGDGPWSASGTGRTGGGGGGGNSAPAFAEDALSRAVAENAAPGVPVGAPIPAAVDADVGDTLTYTLAGADADAFGFDVSLRQITALAALDFEARASYSVTVGVTDGKAGDSVEVTIAVTDVDEPPGAPETLVVSGPLDSSERLDVRWSAPDNTGRPAIERYELQYREPAAERWSEGQPELTGTSFAVVTALTADTEYEVRVRAVNDEGTGPWSTAAGRTPQTPPAIASASVDASELTLMFDKALDESSTPGGGAFEVEVTPADGAPGMAEVDTVRVSGDTVVLTLAKAVRSTHEVTVQYQAPDANPLIGGGRKVPSFDEPWAVTNVTPPNRAPVFPVAALTRMVEENAVPGAPVGEPVPAASDADGDAPVYAMTGEDADAFGFDAVTRQITAVAALDFETRTSYSVTVGADDGDGGTDTVTVRIGVVDVLEPAPRPAPPVVRSLDGLEVGLAVSWREPQANGGPGIVGYDVRYREGERGEWREWSHAGPRTDTAVTGLKPFTTYQVQVRARNGEAPSAWSGAGTGATGAPAGDIAQAWLARFGRVASDNTMRAIENRWRGERVVDEASHLTVGGYRVNALFDSGGDRQVGGGAFADRDLPEMSGMAGSLGVATAGGDGLTAGAPSGNALSGQSGGPPATPVSPEGGPRTVSPAMSAAPASLEGRPRTDSRAGVLSVLGDLVLGTVSRGGALPGVRDLLLGSSFFYSAAAPGQPGAPGQWALWGEVGASRLSARAGAVSLDGDVATGTVGTDLHRGRWFGGVALSYSEGAGAYRHGTGATGALRSTMTSVNPYLRYEHDERTSFWGVLGLGAGEWSLTPQGSAAGRSHDLTTTLAAFGGRGVLTQAPGGVGLAIRSDVRATETVSDALSGLADDVGLVSRARVLLEGTRSWALETDALLGVTVEAGVRVDGGDAETGVGAEVGGALSYASGRLAVQASARTLAAYQSAQHYRERGTGVSVLYRARGDGRGVSLRLGSAWGATESGVQQLWAQRDARGLVRGAGAAQMGQRYEMELGYGIAGRRAAVLWRPWFGAQSTWGGAPALRLGLQLTSGRAFETGVEFGHRPGLRGARADNAVLVRGAVRW